MTLRPPTAPERPLLALLLIAYNQEATIGAAIAGALAQTYASLEIFISDDASSDGTFQAMQSAVAGYAGPHRVVLNRNERNLGIGAHVSRLVAMAKGELIVIAAGDDVSLPERCERVAAAWLASGCKVDLVASALEDVDGEGRVHGRIVPADLASYHSAADWNARPPFVVGAAQAWTKRLFDRFGPLPEGVVAEDLLMVFRAVVSGGAVTLAEPLVRYRRGGLSRRRRTMSAGEVVERLLKNNRHSLVELPQLLADAGVAGQLQAVEGTLKRQLAREVFIRDLFGATNLAQRLRVIARSGQVALTQRLRFGLYAICPGLLAPLFWVKQTINRIDA